MNEMQAFLIEKLKIGAKSINKQEGTPAMMGATDIELLLKKTSTVNPENGKYVGITEQEGLTWSKDIHWVFQRAFDLDTEQYTNIKKLDSWRALTPYYTGIVSENRIMEMLVIDSLAGHFMRHDLLPVVVRIYGKKNLTEIEKRWPASKFGPGIGSGSGCLVSMFAIIIVILLVFGI